MAVVLMPLAGSSVFGPRWSEHHRPTATASMDAECIVTRQASGGTTAQDGTWTPGSTTTIYTGVCRVITAARVDRYEVVGAAQETHRRLQVSVRWDAPEILVGDLVDVTVAADPRLAGKGLRVAEIAYGSEQWQRDLICTEREA